MSKIHDARRVISTGIGVVAPGGVGTKPFWEVLTAGRTVIRLLPSFDASPLPLPGGGRRVFGIAPAGSAW